MKPLKDIFLIKPDGDGSELPIKGLNGENLFIHKRFANAEYSPQYGEIFEVPLEFSKEAGDCANLKKGDKIFFSYLICEEINKVNILDEEFYFCHYGQIHAKYENEVLTPLNNVFFAEKVMENNLYVAN